MSWGITLLQPDFNDIEEASSHKGWLVFVEGQVLPAVDGGYIWSSSPDAVGTVLQQYALGSFDNRSITAVELAASESTEQKTVSLRSVILQGETPGFLLHQAASLLNWGRHHRFCPSCGQPLTLAENIEDRARSCSACTFRAYPAVNPCIITLIHRGNDVLLARGLRHPPGFHSLIAGFVEPGESLEQAVIREVMEETGLSVTDIQYQHSQPWPFPHNIMMGFHARYESGDIRLDTQELAHADWYSLDNLPQLPPPQTIAWQLIDRYRRRSQLSGP